MACGNRAQLQLTGGGHDRIVDLRRDIVVDAVGHQREPEASGRPPALPAHGHADRHAADHGTDAGVVKRVYSDAGGADAGVSRGTGIGDARQCMGCDGIDRDAGRGCEPGDAGPRRVARRGGRDHHRQRRPDGRDLRMVGRGQHDRARHIDAGVRNARRGAALDAVVCHPGAETRPAAVGNGPGHGGDPGGIGGADAQAHAANAAAASDAGAGIGIDGVVGHRAGDADAARGARQARGQGVDGAAGIGGQYRSLVGERRIYDKRLGMAGDGVDGHRAGQSQRLVLVGGDRRGARPGDIARAVGRRDGDVCCTRHQRVAKARLGRLFDEVDRHAAGNRQAVFLAALRKQAARCILPFQGRGCWRRCGARQQVARRPGPFQDPGRLLGVVVV